MRKWIILGIIALLAIVIGEAQENFDKLPPQAITLIETYYADHTIDKIDIDLDSEMEHFQVKFTNDTKIDFGKDGKPTEISGEEAIPNALIPEKMKYFLENRFENDYVTEWKMDDKGHEIEMDNGAELLFDLEGNFLRNKSH